MKDSNMGALVAKRVAFSALILAGIIVLFKGLSLWQSNTANLDWRVWTFIGFWGVALAVDTYRFITRNALAQTVVRYGDAETGQDRLDAILQVTGYTVDQKQGSKIWYKPTVFAGTFNRMVVMEVKARHAIIDGPSFVIDRVEERVEVLNYIDMLVDNAADMPMGNSAIDHNTRSEMSTSEAEVMNPRTA